MGEREWLSDPVSAAQERPELPGRPLHCLAVGGSLGAGAERTCLSFTGGRHLGARSCRAVSAAAGPVPLVQGRAHCLGGRDREGGREQAPWAGLAVSPCPRAAHRCWDPGCPCSPAGRV